MIQNPSPQQETLLSAFQYQDNQAVLHSDKSVMPNNKNTWSSWNYVVSDTTETTNPCVTYYMNKLQNLECEHHYFVTLNSTTPIARDKVIKEIKYEHPVFNLKAMAAQKQLPELNSAANVLLFCGSYFNYGFHEDAFNSALALSRILRKKHDLL